MTPDQVTVEMRRHGAEIPALRAWLAQLSSEPLGDRDHAALIIAKREGRVSVASLRDQLRIDSDDARDLLGDLASRGLLHQTETDDYELWSDEPPLRPVEAEVLKVLSFEVPVSIKELTDALGKKPESLRPILRRMIQHGHISATAPPTSRDRKYLRGQNAAGGRYG